jgi:FMN phosphatase YigB (HAD superfamily)
MKPGTIKRLQRVEQASNVTPRTVVVWDDHEGDDALAAKIAGMKASGHAKEGDRFVTVGWQPASDLEP